MTLVPIGRFARASRLSVKSLRGYHDSGLLPAAFVDPNSGYRYYEFAQLVRADAIRSLRMAGLPLAQVAEALDGGSPDEVLSAHLAELGQRRAEIDHQVRQVQRLIEREDLAMAAEVTVESTPAGTVAAWRTDTDIPAVFSDIPAGFQAVLGYLAAAGVEPAGAPYTIFHEIPDPETPGNVETCLPIAAAAPGDGSVTVRPTPALVSASLVHVGSYEQMSESYATAAAWIQERGHRIVGPHREVYLNSPAEVPEAELRTRIMFPIDGEPADRG